MAVPTDIQAVLRPTNTVIDDNGRNESKRYAIRTPAFVKIRRWE